MTILDAIHDRHLFGPWFSQESWRAWRIFLAAVFALPIEGADLEVYRRHTGRKDPPEVPAREAYVIKGRRGGGSRIAALIAVYLACFRDYSAILAPGEVGTVMIIAADRRQARTVMRYINGFLDGVPMLARMVVSRTAESVTLTNNVVIEVHTCSFRTVRGYTIVAAIFDEVAFWRTDEDAAEPDSEVKTAVLAGMLTVPDAVLLGFSSPYARRGLLWEMHSKHYGKDGDPVLVWQGDTRSMNPLANEEVIAAAYAEDEIAASAEYGAEFRRDVESFVSREAVMACVAPDRAELPPQHTRHYVAFVDPAGGSGADSYTLAIAHAEPEGRIVLDAIRERRPPFSPDDATAEFAAVLREYRVGTVQGDRWGGSWPSSALQKHGISYQTADKPKSDLYKEALPMLTAQRLELLDHQRLIAQLTQLERRTARGGRDSIDHPPRGHDDVVNAVMGAALLAHKSRTCVIGWLPTLR